TADKHIFGSRLDAGGSALLGRFSHFAHRGVVLAAHAVADLAGECLRCGPCGQPSQRTEHSKCQAAFHLISLSKWTFTNQKLRFPVSGNGRFTDRSVRSCKPCSTQTGMPILEIRTSTQWCTSRGWSSRGNGTSLAGRLFRCRDKAMCGSRRAYR